MSIPSTYRRIEYPRFGDASLFGLSAPLPTPDPKSLAPTDVLVRVLSVGANPLDSKIRRGEMWFASGRKFPMGTGLEFCGTVLAKGSAVSHVNVGDRIWGGLSGMVLYALSEILVVNGGNVARAPAGLSDLEAGASPVVILCTLQAFVAANLGKKTSPARVLINGATGGVGHIAVQVAKRVYGAHVTALCSGSSAAFAKELGADVVLDYSKPEVNGKEHELAGGNFDVWFDCAGKKGYWQVRHQLQAGGTYVTLNPGLFTMLDAYVLTGWFGTSGSRVIITSFTTEELDKGKEIVEKYGLKPTLGDVFAFEDAAKAYAKIDTGKGIKGKVVFEVAKI